MEKRTLTLDIDQTLAGGVVPAHMLLYNQRLNFGMSPEEIKATEKFPKTFDVPQVLAFRGKGEDAEKEFQKVRSEIRTSEFVHLSLTELPGSVEGVLDLLDGNSEIIFGGYYSVRPNEVGSATGQWLKDKKYPHPDKYTICSSPQDKLMKIIKDFRLEDSTNGDSVILIDDSLKDLSEAAKIIVSADPAKRKAIERIVVVGFGQTESKRAELEGAFYPATGLRTLSLPSWHPDHLKGLKEALSGIN